MNVEEGDQRTHEERGDDRADADGAEDPGKVLSGEQQQDHTQRHADKVADHTAVGELELMLPL